jgi:hypothetical protein
MSYIKLFEQFVNESTSNVGDFNSILTKNGYVEVSNKTTPSYGGGDMRSFDYKNPDIDDIMIRIIDSPTNNVYVEIYKNNSQATPFGNSINTTKDLIKGAKKYANTVLKP